MKPITPEEVVAAASAIAYMAMNQATSNVKELHDRGYGDYARAMGNMRTKIETALSELTDEVMPNE